MPHLSAAASLLANVPSSAAHKSWQSSAFPAQPHTGPTWLRARVGSVLRLHPPQSARLPKNAQNHQKMPPPQPVQTAQPAHSQHLLYQNPCHLKDPGFPVSCSVSARKHFYPLLGKMRKLSNGQGNLRSQNDISVMVTVKFFLRKGKFPKELRK